MTAYRICWALAILGLIAAAVNDIKSKTLLLVLIALYLAAFSLLMRISIASNKRQPSLTTQDHYMFDKPVEPVPEDDLLKMIPATERNAHDVSRTAS